MLKITSLQNPRIKQVVQLQKAAERKTTGSFVIEGQREIFLAKHSGYIIKTVFYCNELTTVWDEKYPLKIEEIASELISISKEVFEKIAYRENTSGLVAIAETKHNQLKDIKLPETPLVLVLENIEKPGNIGAILRTADAANIDAILICNNQTDLYNPNTIRSSVGCVFTNQIVSCANEDALAFLLANNISIYTTYLEAEQYYYHTNFNKPSAIVMGSEANGVTPFWLENANAKIKIPMNGKIDSINVSTAAAIIIFEAKRQRDFL
jgi:TrmH family RNA methyltransferase